MATSLPTPTASVMVHLDGAQPHINVQHAAAVVTLGPTMSALTLVASDPESMARVGQALIEASQRLGARRVADAQIVAQGR